MKILHTVESYLPSVHGMSVVVQQLSERLASAGHEVVIATKSDSRRSGSQLSGVHIESFTISGNTVEGITAEQAEIVRYQQLLQDPSFDIVVNFAAQQWATDLALPILKHIAAKKVFVPTGFSALHNPTYAEYFAQMPEYLNTYDMNIFLSHTYQDIAFAEIHGVPKEKCIVIANGADEREFTTPSTLTIRQKLAIPDTHKLLLLVGAHTGLKGHREAIEIFSKADIGPATLLIVATTPAHSKRGLLCTLRCNGSALWSRWTGLFSDKKIIVTSLTRPETIAAFRQADLFLFPSNIECSPLVLFESLAAGLPFLTTDTGNAKEIIDWTHGGILLPTIHHENGYSYADIASSVPIVEKLLKDPVQCTELSSNGHHAWQTKFTWEKIAQAYSETYMQLIAEKKP